MGIPVLIMGESGSGKTASLRNFTETEVGIFNVAGKPLPFRKKLNKIDNAKYQDIGGRLKAIKLKTYVIGVSVTVAINGGLFDKAKEVGYNKFTDIGVHFRNLVDYVIRELPEDVIVYFLHHTEATETGKIKAKTVGKMLDNQLTLEGLFSIVLLCKTDGKEHCFETQSDGFTTCKSPMEMFEMKIDNDLKMVDTTIREYYGFKGGNENE